MPTTKKRINITLGKEEEEFLSVLAKGDQVPVATKASALLKEILEIYEDQEWERLAEERVRSGEARVSHEDAWKNAI